MIDLCNGNTLNCLNNGQCAADITSNTTYCECASCHDGSVCEHTITRQSQIDTTYVYLIVSIIALFFSLLNNILGLELFIGCSRVRRTNCGIYLIVYSILSVLSSISFVVNQSLAYYVEKIANNALMNFPDYQCYFAKIGYNSLVYACIWLNACIAFERGLIVCFDSKTNATRWRSVCTITVLTVIAGGSAIPMMVYHCDFGNIPSLQTARLFLVWFSTVAGLSTYVLAILLILLSFARRIRRYGTENGSFMKTYLKLFYSHLFIFIPPFAYAFGYIPYTIVTNTQDPTQLYFQCGISKIMWRCMRKSMLKNLLTSSLIRFRCSITSEATPLVPRHQKAWILKNALETEFYETIGSKFDAIGISEVRWTGKGEVPSGDFIWSGEDTTHTRGVGVLLSAKTKKTLIGYNPISSRVITARFNATPFKLTVIRVYTPTSASSDDEIEIFYDSIEHALTQTPKMDIIIVTGDWDAKIGSDNIHWKSVMVRYEYGDINERGRPTSRVHSTAQSIYLQYTILTKSK
ncbi:unnamed protein product [Rotaria magnacalcarata]